MKLKTLDVLSAVSGIMCSSDFGDVHEACEKLAGHPVWTHQMPRVCDDFKKHYKDHPILKERVPEVQYLCEGLEEDRKAMPDGDAITKFRAGLDEIVAEVGEHMDIEPMNGVFRDPMEELQEMTKDRKDLVTIPVIH